MLPQKLAFIDVETTGLRPTVDRVIEIGIIRVEDGKVVETFNSLINPQCYVPKEIELLTNITSEQVEAAPTFGQLKRDIGSLLADCVFVAHNARFDYGFIKNEFKREYVNFTSKQLCTAKLSRSLFPERPRHNLDSIIELFSITCENRHRAFDDAWVLWEFYQRIIDQFGDEVLSEQLNKVTKRPTLPPNLTQAQLDELPSSPGVYIFYADDGTPIYVGKSKSIRDRVMSHFSADHQSNKEMQMAQQVHRIETIETCGELGALLKESQLVKQMQPVFNRRLRQMRLLSVVRLAETKQGYKTVSIEPYDTQQPIDLSDVIGFFKGRMKAKNYINQMAEQHNLCKKLLDLENTSVSCFGYRLDNCKGACVGKESALHYNLRFDLAFGQTAVEPWLFDSPVVIVEKEPLGTKQEAFLVDKWCYLGSKSIDIEVEDGSLEDVISTASNEYLFDLDSYKILSSFLRQKKNLRNIHQIRSSASL